MIRDITLGQYYPADSVIHRLDARTKLIGTMAFIISLFLFGNWEGFIVATAFLVGVIRLSKVPVRFMLKGLKAIVVLLAITAVFNIFVVPGDIIWQLGFLKVTKQGLSKAGFMALRLSYLIVGSSVMTSIYCHLLSLRVIYTDRFGMVSHRRYSVRVYKCRQNVGKMSAHRNSFFGVVKAI